MERDAKDQIREKKIRCAFLPPLEHAITQIQEEDESVSHSTASTHQQSPQAFAPPTTAHIQTTSSTSAAPSLISRDSYNSTTSTSTGTDAQKLKRDLDNAQHIIQNLQNSVKQLEAETNTVSATELSSLFISGIKVVKCDHSHDTAALVSFHREYFARDQYVNPHLLSIFSCTCVIFSFVSASPTLPRLLQHRP